MKVDESSSQSFLLGMESFDSGGDPMRREGGGNPLMMCGMRGWDHETPEVTKVNSIFILYSFSRSLTAAKRTDA